MMGVKVEEEEQDGKGNAAGGNNGRVKVSMLEIFVGMKGHTG